ncbi:MAG TPA: diphosphomevalonate decarboxylase [Flavobacteriales bacterium]|jgi:diphosphomevalonate decarboxylase|nr:diphosphomevalonate decarboxylase [Flavobacteriales bacterium]
MFRGAYKIPSELQGEVTWQSPSNIALVKYWGKYNGQIPMNPSVSFTLSESKTKTTLKFRPKQKKSVQYDFFFEGKKAPEFGQKALSFLEKATPFLPFISELDFEIHTSNTFPHSSGIASSASGMSALSLCLMSIEQKCNPTISPDFFYQKSSFLSRIGSGSACRSVFGSVVEWGVLDGLSESNDLYALPIQDVHPVFRDYQDTILLVDEGSKAVSSTVGHSLMNRHPYRETRKIQAGKNAKSILEVLRQGDLESFVQLVEQEALTLHALMMMSHPYFILMKPNTLKIIQQLWAFREQSGVPLCFTLDAGANVHVMYPGNDKETVMSWIKSDIVEYCQNENYICDHVGKGPKKLT